MRHCGGGRVREAVGELVHRRSREANPECQRVEPPVLGGLRLRAHRTALEHASLHARARAPLCAACLLPREQRPHVLQHLGGASPRVRNVEARARPPPRILIRAPPQRLPPKAPIALGAVPHCSAHGRGRACNARTGAAGVRVRPQRRRCGGVRTPSREGVGAGGRRLPAGPSCTGSPS